MKEITVPMLVELANRNVSMQDGFEAVKDCVASATVAIAIWQDRNFPDNVGMLVLKGIDVVRTAATEQVLATVTNITAIRCIDAEQAYALREAFGDRTTLQ